MNLTITKAMAVESVTKAVETKGADHTATCDYLNNYDNQKPKCIVGHALFGLGVAGEILGEMDDCGETIDGSMVLTVLKDAGVTIDSNALTYLTNAQSWQDARYGWGRALEEANAGRHWKDSGLPAAPADDLPDYDW